MRFVCQIITLAVLFDPAAFADGRSTVMPRALGFPTCIRNVVMGHAMKTSDARSEGPIGQAEEAVFKAYKARMSDQQILELVHVLNQHIEAERRIDPRTQHQVHDTSPREEGRNRSPEVVDLTGPGLDVSLANRYENAADSYMVTEYDHRVASLRVGDEVKFTVQSNGRPVEKRFKLLRWLGAGNTTHIWEIEYTDANGVRSRKALRIPIAVGRIADRDALALYSSNNRAHQALASAEGALADTEKLIAAGRPLQMLREQHLGEIAHQRRVIAETSDTSTRAVARWWMRKFVTAMRERSQRYIAGVGGERDFNVRVFESGPNGEYAVVDLVEFEGRETFAEQMSRFRTNQQGNLGQTRGDDWGQQSRQAESPEAYILRMHRTTPEARAAELREKGANPQQIAEFEEGLLALRRHGAIVENTRVREVTTDVLLAAARDPSHLLGEPLSEQNRSAVNTAAALLTRLGVISGPPLPAQINRRVLSTLMGPSTLTPTQRSQRVAQTLREIGHLAPELATSWGQWLTPRIEALSEGRAWTFQETETRVETHVLNQIRRGRRVGLDTESKLIQIDVDYGIRSPLQSE